MGVSVCMVCGSPLKPRALACPVCGASNSGFAGSALPAVDPIHLPQGSELKSYTLLGVLGQGGFGITYRAKKANTEVAIKEFFPDGAMRIAGTVQPPSGMDSSEFEALQQKFLEEYSILKRFMQGKNHPNIVDVVETFAENGTMYLVMELLRGETLEARIIKNGNLKAKQVRHIAKDLGAALETIHKAGLLHRDIKPANVFLEQGGRVVLIDFGSSRDFKRGQTMRHTRMVTPGYAPLEQYSTQARVDASSDIYALAATLYHAITGNVPPTAVERMNGATLTPLSTRLGSGLRQAIEKGLALQMSDRPHNVQAFVQLIDKNVPVVAPKPTSPNPTPVLSSSTYNNDFLAFAIWSGVAFILSAALAGFNIGWFNAWVGSTFGLLTVFLAAWMYTSLLEVVLMLFGKTQPVSLLRRVWIMLFGIAGGFLVFIFIGVSAQAILPVWLVLSFVVSGFLMRRAYRFPSPAQQWSSQNIWDGFWLLLIAGLLEWTGIWDLLF